MSNMIKKFETGFTQMPNWVLTATDISLAAKGLYAYLFSKPDGWQFHFSAIEKEICESRGQFLARMKELTANGYIIQKQYNENGRFGGMIYEFVNKPRIRSIACPEISVYGKTDTLNNTDLSNNTYSNNNTDYVISNKTDVIITNNEDIFTCEKNDKSTSGSKRKKQTTSRDRPNVEPYGEFKNVYLTKDEVEKLIKKYEWYFKDAIELLSSYLAMHEDKYKNHYAVLCENNWVWTKVHANDDCGIPSSKIIEDETAPGKIRHETPRECYIRKNYVNL